MTEGRLFRTILWNHNDAWSFAGVGHFCEESTRRGLWWSLRVLGRGKLVEVRTSLLYVL